jgi:hypothetical protein
MVQPAVEGDFYHEGHEEHEDEFEVLPDFYSVVPLVFITIER